MPFDDDCDSYLSLIKTAGSGRMIPPALPRAFSSGHLQGRMDNDGDTLIDTADRGCPWAS
jgi:hypothetical protein